MSLKVIEIFQSIQGEGLRSGQVSIFIRLAGCNLRCSFCDTKYAWGKGKKMKEDDIIKEVVRHSAPWVVITGGEPFYQDIEPLLRKLKCSGYKIQIESNGSYIPYWSSGLVDHLTVSPKEANGGYSYDDADIAELKYVVDKSFPISKIDWKFKNPVYIQPMSNLPKNIRYCISLIGQFPSLRLSLQLHKILKIR